MHLQWLLEVLAVSVKPTDQIADHLVSDLVIHWLQQKDVLSLTGCGWLLEVAGCCYQESVCKQM